MDVAPGRRRGCRGSCGARRGHPYSAPTGGHRSVAQRSGLGPDDRPVTVSVSVSDTQLVRSVGLLTDSWRLCAAGLLPDSRRVRSSNLLPDPRCARGTHELADTGRAAFLTLPRRPDIPASDGCGTARRERTSASIRSRSTSRSVTRAVTARTASKPLASDERADMLVLVKLMQMDGRVLRALAWCPASRPVLALIRPDRAPSAADACDSVEP